MLENSQKHEIFFEKKEFFQICVWDSIFLPSSHESGASHAPCNQSNEGKVIKILINCPKPPSKKKGQPRLPSQNSGHSIWSIVPENYSGVYLFSLLFKNEYRAEPFIYFSRKHLYPTSIPAQIQWFQVLKACLHSPETIYLNQIYLSEWQILIKILWKRKKKILYQPLLPRSI